MIRGLLILCCILAPVPKYRTPAPVSIVGTWRMAWGVGTYTPVAFARDGYYECGAMWRGSWTRQGEILTVTESMPESDAPPITWRVTLDPGQRRGKLDSGVAFALGPIKEE